MLAIKNQMSLYHHQQINRTISHIIDAHWYRQSLREKKQPSI